jgi:hypothetical protein
MIEAVYASEMLVNLKQNIRDNFSEISTQLVHITYVIRTDQHLYYGWSTI